MKNGTHVYKDRVEICIPVQPITKKNSQKILKKRVLSKGVGKTIPFIAPSDQFVRYQKDASFFLRSLGLDYPMNVEAHFYMGTLGVVDLSNLNEAIHDIMVVAGVIKDDEAYFIVSTDGSRVHYDKDNPRTEITITRTEPTFPMRPKLKEYFSKKGQSENKVKTKIIRRKQ